MSECQHCKKLGAKSYCSSCKSSYYCNVECQRADWKKHKRKCKKLRKKQTKDNKTDKHVIQLHLPCNKSNIYTEFKRCRCNKYIQIKYVILLYHLFRLQALNSLFSPKKISLYENVEYMNISNKS